MKKTTLIEDVGHWQSDQTYRVFLDAIFKDEKFKAEIATLIAKKNLKIDSMEILIGFLRQVFRDSIRWGEADPNYDHIRRLGELAEYEKTLHFNVDAYRAETKPNPKGVFWPNPKRDPDSDIYKMLPYARTHGIVKPETPIGSAGSCFAFEISYALQRRKFNYVVTEKINDPQNGVYGGEPNEEFARFSANWGILFNTPSFRQLAEKAFGDRELPRLLAPFTVPPNDTKAFVDPFRENVYFLSVEAYEKNYDRHIAAAREAFLKSEVFVITLGLNECWEYLADGSVFSRNPHSLAFTSLVRHRVLTVAENVANVQRLIDVVRAHNPKFKLIVSVSPVPFLATARGHEHHVISANTHSKSVLRVAAEEIVKANKDVYYFPSYELVSACAMNPWEADQRHVNRPTVERVMDLFNAMFVEGGK